MFEVVKLATGLISGWISGRQKIQQAEQDRKIAAIENQTRLLADKDKANSAWEMAALQESDKPLKRICFAIFSFPMVYAAINPESVAHYFQIALAVLPDWYIKAYLGIVGSIWGIASLKDAIPAVINQIRAWKDPDKK